MEQSGVLEHTAILCSSELNKAHMSSINKIKIVPGRFCCQAGNNKEVEQSKAWEWSEDQLL